MQFRAATLELNRFVMVHGFHSQTCIAPNMMHNHVHTFFTTGSIFRSSTLSTNLSIFNIALWLFQSFLGSGLSWVSANTQATVVNPVVRLPKSDRCKKKTQMWSGLFVKNNKLRRGQDWVYNFCWLSRYKLCTFAGLATWCHIEECSTSSRGWLLCRCISSLCFSWDFFFQYQELTQTIQKVDVSGMLEDPKESFGKLCIPCLHIQVVHFWTWQWTCTVCVYAPMYFCM